MSIKNHIAGYHQQINVSETLTQKPGNGGLPRQSVMDADMKFINRKRAGEAENAASDENHLDKVSLVALMLTIMMDRAELLESSLRDQVQTVQKKNAKLKQANAMMARARAAKKGSSEESKTEMPEDVTRFFADNKIPWGEEDGGRINANVSHKLDSAEWDLAIQNMQGWSESLTSSSQLDMTKLQSISGKFNQTFEMLSQFTARHFRTLDSLIKNI